MHPILIHIDVSIQIILPKSNSKRFFFWSFRTFSQSMFKISRILIICLWKRKNVELLRKNRPKPLKQTSWKSNEIWPPWKSNSRPFNQGRINILTNTFQTRFFRFVTCWKFLRIQHFHHTTHIWPISMIQNYFQQNHDSAY